MEKDLKKRVRRIITLLKKQYPDAKTALNFTNPLELLVATVLSSQCTDERVNRVTQTLFKKYPFAEDYARAPLDALEEDIRPTGFFRNKAKSIHGICKDLLEKHNGKVPADLNALVKLP